MVKECLECNTEIMNIQKVYIEGKEVCPYCFSILDISITENIISKDLIDTITNESILNELLSNFKTEKIINIPMILFIVFLMVLATIFPLIISLFI